jgi:excisionase family DNA binding protein
VSRPFLIEQLEKGVIPHRKVGTHRRVMFADVMKYKHAMDQNRLKALEELSALDQELGFD